MIKLLLPVVVVLVASSGWAQKPVPVVPPAPGAKNPATIPRPAIASDTQILEFGSFEFPRVKERTPKVKGGNPLTLSSSEWALFNQPPNKEGGALTVGLTNEVAHTGRQSIYVEFAKLTKQNAIAEISTQALRIKPGAPYRVSIWGQMDKKQALTIAQRIPNLRLQVDFFSEGLAEQVDQQFSVQQMPGSRNRAPLFVANRWNEFYLDVTAPEEAHYIKLTWSWVSPNEVGETNGVMYFDDAALIGEAVEEPEETDTPDPAVMKRVEGEVPPDSPATGEPEAAPGKPMPAEEAAPKPADAPEPVPSVPKAATPKSAEAKAKATPAKKKP